MNVLFPNLNIVNFYHSKSLLHKLLQLLEANKDNTLIHINYLPNVLRSKAIGSLMDVVYVYIAPLIKLEHQNLRLWWIGGWSRIPKDVFEKPVWESKFVTLDSLDGDINTP